MNANREKTASIMGFVISMLLHGIFLAGCVAIDFTIEDQGTVSNSGKTEIPAASNHMDIAKAKS